MCHAKLYFRCMKTILFHIAFFFCAIVGYSQNLVPNAGFEVQDTCPNSGDQIQYATGWYKVSAAATTPDYYNACSSPTETGVPQSLYLYQQDPRSCGAYAGLGTWSYTGNNDREQIGIQLSQPLVIGQKYFISFKTVMGGTSDGTFYFESPANNACLRLSTVAHSPANPAPIDNFAHLRSVTVISDTLNWVRVSGSMIADSAYNFVMLGNFFDDANTDTTTLNCANCVNSYSYYLFDNICVSTDSIYCNGGIDAAPCTVSIPELYNDNQFSVFPNPTNSLFTIRNRLKTSFNVEIYNSIGEQIYSKNEVVSDDLKLDIGNVSNGLYFITITSHNNKFSYKLLKQ